MLALCQGGERPGRHRATTTLIISHTTSVMPSVPFLTQATKILSLNVMTSQDVPSAQKGTSGPRMVRLSASQRATATSLATSPCTAHVTK